VDHVILFKVGFAAGEEAVIEGFERYQISTSLPHEGHVEVVRKISLLKRCPIA